MRKSFEPQCYILALHFYPRGNSSQLEDIAQHIQNSILDYLQNVEFDEEAKRQSAHDRAVGI